jgi:predicted ATPase
MWHRGARLQRAILGDLDLERSPAGRRASEMKAHDIVPHAKLRRRGSSFIGRQVEARSLAVLLEHERLVTVFGPPGIGKSRLAQRTLDDRDSATAWLCDLAEVADIEGICRAVGSTLGVPLGDGGSGAASVELLGRALAGLGPLFLVLDNIEGVVAHATATIGRWLSLAPEARFLVTSRERLRLFGEVVFDLGPLAMPDVHDDPGAFEAVQLFVERAQAGRRSFVLTREEAGRVVALVRALDGNPLAIELMATRTRVLTTAELLESLPMRLDAFPRNASDASTRHRTLRDTVASSWRRLPIWEQAALAQCAVFRGGFNARAGQDVIDLSAYPGAPPTLQVILALCDKSLLFQYEDPARAGRVRFRLLVGVRELATEVLDNMGGREAAAARHARHYLDCARGWAAVANTRGCDDAREHLVLEVENLLAVCHRALGRSPSTTQDATEAGAAVLALRPVLLEREPRILLDLLAAALAAPCMADVAAPLRARMLMARAQVHLFLDRKTDCCADCEDALAVVGRANEPRLLGEILLVLSRAHLLDSRLQEAEAEITRALTMDSPDVRVCAFTWLGELRRRQQRLTAARQAFDEGLRLNREIGNLRAEGVIRCGLAGIDRQVGRLEEATMHLESARLASDELGRSLGAAWTIESGAAVEVLRGRFAAPGAVLWRSRASLGALTTSFPAPPDPERELARPEGALLRPALGSPGGENGAPALVVPSVGNWFWLPSGNRIDAPGKLCRLLRTLVAHHQRAPGAPLSIDELIERGWPGEKMHPEAGAKRVYTAIWHLRRLGLKDAILRVDGGYMLDPGVRTEIAHHPPTHANQSVCA